MSKGKRKRKKRRNRKTLKKKIRRIINVVILCIFLISAVVNTWVSYNLVVYGTRIAAEIFGRTSSVLVDGDDLKQINSVVDFEGEAYQRINDRLTSAFPEFFLEGPLHFSILKEINGQLVSVIDNKDKIFINYEISEEKLEDLKNQEKSFSLLENEGATPFGTIAYAPIIDSNGEMVGVFAARFSQNFQMVIFGVSVLLIMLLTVVGLFLGLLITRLMTIRITKPLEVLDAKIRDIARAEGDLSQRVVFENTYREVENLAEATNMVMESTGHFVRLLEEKQYRLEEKNKQLAQQAEELEAQTEELLALNENLEEAMQKLKDTQVQLVQSEKMASLGQLTAGVAHEINTPLGAINSNTGIIEMIIKLLKDTLDLEENPKLVNIVQKLDKANETNKLACDRIIQIVRHLKSFARLDESDFKEACLNSGIESVLILSHNLLKHRITVHKEFGELPLVKCFPNQLNQVFMNIIVNAAQAIEGEGDIWIKTWAEAEKVFVQIKDSGSGIPEEYLQKIFDPGFTTKGVGVGTGLGLSICYKIIDQHNGKIIVDSTPGQGSTFTIELPMDNSFEDMRNEEAL